MGKWDDHPVIGLIGFIDDAELRRRIADAFKALLDENESLLSAGASRLGKRGGEKGGVARKAALSPERRAEIARTAALARHGKTVK
jgi:hypothetical protein